MANLLSRTALIPLLLVLLGVVGCSDDTQNNATSQNPPLVCSDGSSPNPITGMCSLMSRDMSNDASDQTRDTSGVDSTPQRDQGSDTQDSGMDDDMVVDVSCKEGVDSDNDGLDNACECSWGTKQYIKDSDGDGIDDGDEDADRNCSIGPDETDPRRADTDSDGIEDGDEIANGTNPKSSDSDGDGLPDKLEQDTCTDPLLSDSDSDGLDDGVEDFNLDGNIGTCPNRQFDIACSEGESDPCNADSDGDGIPDTEEVQYRRCRPEDTQNLIPPQLVASTPGDYQLAVDTAATTSVVTSATGTPLAYVFNGAANAYTGFIVRLTPPNSSVDPSELSDAVFSGITSLGAYSGATRRTAGRRLSTHDAFKAQVNAIVDLPDGVSASEARDAVLAQLTGLSDLTHSITAPVNGQPNQPTLFTYEVIARSATEYILVAAIVPFGTYSDASQEAGWRVADLTGGTSVAKDGEPLEPDCVSYKVIARPKVDIIISVDASGSITAERMRLANFSNELVTLLDAANLDWRVGVTSVACSGIQTDMGLPQDYRSLWPAGGGPFSIPPAPCSEPFGGGGDVNGALIGGGFATDAATISTRINNANSSNSEYTLTMGAAAVARALPRAASSSTKLREGAAVVVIVVTDEEDLFFKNTLDFLPEEYPSASEQLTLDAATQPWVDYLLKPEIGATVFGLYYVPGDGCTEAQPATAIHDIVTQTGGNGGSICQGDITTTLQTIANATAGIASGLRLRGSPVAPSIGVRLADISAGMLLDVARSRQAGFDYDGVVNRVAFYGANGPQTGDRAIIPYLRWKNSVIACSVNNPCPSEQKQTCQQGICL